MLVGKHLMGHEIRRRHVLWGAAAVGLVLAMLGLTALPDAGLRWGLVRGLRNLGLVEISVSEVDLSLFDGAVVLHRITARPPLGGAPLGIKDFTLAFRWAPLLSKRIAIDTVTLEGIEIHARRTGDGGLIIDGLPLGLSESPPPPARAAEAAPATPWGIDLGSLELTDSRLELTDRDVTVSIALKRLAIGNLHSRDPDRPTTVVLDGTVNDSLIHLTGELRPFAEQPNFSADLAVEGLDPSSLAKLAGRFGVEGLDAQGRLRLAINGALGETGLSLAIGGRIELDRLTLARPVDLSVGSLALDLGQAHWTSTHASLSPRIETGAITLKAGDASLALASLAADLSRLVWDGKRLELAGTIGAKDVRAARGDRTLALASLGFESRDLAWDGRLAWEGGLRLADAKATAPEGEGSLDLLAWSGRLDLDPAGVAPTGSADGRLELTALAGKALDFAVTLKHGAVETRSAFDGTGAFPVTGTVKPVLDGLSVRQPGKGLDWLSLDHVDGGEIRLAADGTAGSDAVALAGLAALRQNGRDGYPWRVEARSVRLDHPVRDEDGGLEAEELRLEGMTVRITRTRDGFAGLPPPSPLPPDPKAKKTDEPGPSFSLGRLAIGGGSQIQFRDRSLAEPVRLEAQGVEAFLADLDSDEPERDSPFDVKVAVGQAAIAVSGTVRPLAERLSGRLDGRIRSLELVPLSPYLAEALGINLQTGQFSGRFTGAAAKGVLDGKLEVDLANLFIAPPDPGAAVTRKMDMPVETVLNLLRDGEDRIRLALPIRGDLAKPDLDISDAVAQAVAGALKSTVLTTLKVAFPLLGLIELASDASDHLGLAPLAFDPGESVLTDAHRKALGELGRLMGERRGLRLTLCGKATAADWPVLAQRRHDRDAPILSRLEKLVGAERATEDLGPPDPGAMARLADARVQAAKDFLVDHAGTEAGRVFACRAQVDTADSKPPRVELFL